MYRMACYCLKTPSYHFKMLPSLWIVISNVLCYHTENTKRYFYNVTQKVCGVPKYYVWLLDITKVTFHGYLHIIYYT